MNEKIAEFYSKVTSDDALKAKLDNILGGKLIIEASDAQIQEINDIADELGYNFTFNEVKNFIASGDVQLSDDALEAVAGGINKNTQGDGHTTPPFVDPQANQI